MTSFLHLLNLDTVGGVEELFVHFLKRAKTLSPAEHHLLITGQKPHPLFVEMLSSADSLTYDKYFWGIKIPGFLRPAFRKMRYAPTTTILWNRLEPFEGAKRLIYYEHGASWIAPKSQKLDSFFKQVDKVLANSHAAKRLLELKWNLSIPISVIENPLKPTLQPAAAPKSYPTKFRLGYIGRFIPFKGVSLIFHALKELQDLDCSLTLVGAGPEKEALQHEAKRLNLDVTFLGVQKEVSDFYDSIDILLVPSIREPLGLVAQEAALRGCPVIATCVDGLPEVVAHNVTGLLLPPTLPINQYQSFGGSMHKLPDLVYDPVQNSLVEPRLLDPHNIAQAIRQIAGDKKIFESMSQQAIIFAKNRPNFTTYTQKLLDLISI